MSFTNSSFPKFLDGFAVKGFAHSPEIHVPIYAFVDGEFTPTSTVLDDSSVSQFTNHTKDLIPRISQALIEDDKVATAYFKDFSVGRFEQDLIPGYQQVLDPIDLNQAQQILRNKPETRGYQLQSRPYVQGQNDNYIKTLMLGLTKQHSNVTTRAFSLQLETDFNNPLTYGIRYDAGALIEEKDDKLALHSRGFGIETYWLNAIKDFLKIQPYSEEESKLCQLSFASRVWLTSALLFANDDRQIKTQWLLETERQSLELAKTQINANQIRIDVTNEDGQFLGSVTLDLSALSFVYSSTKLQTLLNSSQNVQLSYLTDVSVPEEHDFVHGMIQLSRNLAINEMGSLVFRENLGSQTKQSLHPYHAYFWQAVLG